MDSAGRQSHRVLLFSSGNPAATFLAAGLLYGWLGNADTVLIQGVGDATPASVVRAVLAEVGLDVRGWVPQVVAAPPSEGVDVGATICVPT